MSLTRHTLHQGPLLHIGCACCRPQDKACGAEEQAAGDTLGLPLNGVFVKHHGGGADVVAASGQGLFFNAGEPYRVSHPAGGSDDCLTLELAPAVQRELLGRYDAAAAERERKPFGATHAALPAELMLQRQLLWRALRSGVPAVEIEERALELFGRVLGASRPLGRSSVDGRPQARRRRAEQARAAAVALAAQPEQDWSLDALSQRVHSSPFHLARSFRGELGEPVHQYLLRMRLNRALEAVLDSGEPLTDLALRLGFATPSHFSAAFRRHYGQTPTALRQTRKISTAQGTAHP
jgi:AraC-like DNA-binding protein